MSKRLKQLHEMVGFFQRPRVNAPVTTRISMLPNPDVYQGIRVSYCSSLKPDQTRILRAMENDPGDVYVMAPPSAGKTGPMICYFAKQHLKLNPELDPTTNQDLSDFFHNITRIIMEPEKIDKMLILVPVVKLAMENYRGFTELFTNIISQIILFAIQKNVSLNDPIFSKEFETLSDNSDKLNSEMLDLTRRKQLSTHQPAINDINTRLSDINILQNKITDRLRILLQNKNDLFKIALNRLYNKIGSPELLGLLDKREQLSSYYQANQNQQLDVMQNLTNRLSELDTNINKVFAGCIKDFIQKNLVAMITGPSSSFNDKASMIVCTYGSARTVIRRLGGAKDQIKFLVCDEAHLIQELYTENSLYEDEEDDSNIGSDDNADVTQASMISSNLYFALDKLRKAKLLLMTGTANPESVRDLIEYLNFCYKRNIKLIGNIPAGNPASLGYMSADWLNNRNQIIDNLLVNPKTTNNLLIVFGKATTLDMIRDTIKRKGHSGMALSNIDAGRHEKFDFQPSGINDRLRKLNPTKINDYYNNNKPIPEDKDKSIVKHVMKGGGAANIVYPMQKRAVEVGVGFICRMTPDMPDYDEKLKESYENDFVTIQDLFKRGIVKTIIATDAVGIGVNIDVRNMYIPNTEKFGGVGKGYEKLLVSNLAQLIARTGRAAFKSATIFAPEQDIPLIQRAMAASSSGSDFEKRRTLKKGMISMAMCKSKLWANSVLSALKDTKDNYYKVHSV